MSEALDLEPTIDLAAELMSITQRQHLNDVHYGVQLVRHALAASPLSVELRVRRHVFELAHNGRPLDEEEHRLLLAVTNPDAPERQEALAALERRFGVALLTVLTTAERVEIEGRRALTAEGGWVRAGRPSDRPGYRIRVHRRARSLRDERAELRFYCRYARVPITLNGRVLNHSLELDEALVQKRVETPEGEGTAAVPLTGALTRVRYFKDGVYFGVRRSLPSDGRPVEAVFDSHVPGVEDNFSRSVTAANDAIGKAKEEVYRELAARFWEAAPRARARTREIVLGLERDRLRAPLVDVPVFHTSARDWRLSLRDLADLARRRGYVPYLRRRQNPDDELPVLDADDVAAVGRLLNRPVRHALTFQPEGGLRARWRALRADLKEELTRTPAREVVPPDRLDPEVRALVTALEEHEQNLSVRVTEGGVVEMTRAGALRTLYVPVDDPELERAVDTWRRTPERIDVIASALVLGT